MTVSPRKPASSTATRRRATAAPRQPTSDDAAARIDRYMASLDPDARKELRRLRAAIKAAAPGAVEVFSYRMPAFKLDGRPLVYYAAWKEHSSLYPITSAIQRALGPALRGYGTSKGTIRFPRTKPIPAALVTRLVKARIAELRQARKR